MSAVFDVVAEEMGWRHWMDAVNQDEQSKFTRKVLVHCDV